MTTIYQQRHMRLYQINLAVLSKTVLKRGNSHKWGRLQYESEFLYK